MTRDRLASDRTREHGRGATVDRAPTSVIYVARQLGRDARLTLTRYGHVIDELDDRPRLPAEDAIRAAREALREQLMSLSVPSRLEPGPSPRTRNARNSRRRREFRAMELGDSNRRPPGCDPASGGLGVLSPAVDLALSARSVLGSSEPRRALTQLMFPQQAQLSRRSLLHLLQTAGTAPSQTITPSSSCHRSNRSRSVGIRLGCRESPAACQGRSRSEAGAHRAPKDARISSAAG